MWTQNGDLEVFGILGWRMKSLLLLEKETCTQLLIVGSSGVHPLIDTNHTGRDSSRKN